MKVLIKKIQTRTVPHRTVALKNRLTGPRNQSGLILQLSHRRSGMVATTESAEEGPCLLSLRTALRGASRRTTTPRFCRLPRRSPSTRGRPCQFAETGGLQVSLLCQWPRSRTSIFLAVATAAVVAYDEENGGACRYGLRRVRYIRSDGGGGEEGHSQHISADVLPTGARDGHTQRTKECESVKDFISNNVTPALVYPQPRCVHLAGPVRTLAKTATLARTTSMTEQKATFEGQTKWQKY